MIIYVKNEWADYFFYVLIILYIYGIIIKKYIYKIYKTFSF